MPLALKRAGTLVDGQPRPLWEGIPNSEKEKMSNPIALERVSIDDGLNPLRRANGEAFIVSPFFIQDIGSCTSLSSFRSGKKDVIPSFFEEHGQMVTPILP